MPFDWGAFLGGYAQGRERSLARKNQEEERKLRERMFKDNLRLQEMTQGRQQQIFDRQQQSYDREAQGREQISAAVGAGPGDMLGQRPQGVEGPTGPEGGFYSFSPERQQSEIRQGLAKAAPASDLNAVFAPGGTQNRPMVVGPGGAVFDPTTGQPIFQNPSQQRQALGAESRMFAIQEKIVNGTATPEEKALFDAWPKTVQTISGARAQAPFDVKADPRNQATQQQFNQAAATGTMQGGALEGGAQTALTALAGLDQSLLEAEKSVSPEFLGPIRGRDITFSARRQVGSMVGAPLSPQETTFRQALGNMSDQLLRARSGAQINEQEFARLAAILPKATDEPGVFKAAIDRFKRELAVIRAERMRLGTTPRATVGNQAPQLQQPQSGGLPPPPPGWK